MDPLIPLRAARGGSPNFAFCDRRATYPKRVQPYEDARKWGGINRLGLEKKNKDAAIRKVIILIAPKTSSTRITMTAVVPVDPDPASDTRAMAAQQRKVADDGRRATVRTASRSSISKVLRGFIGLPCHTRSPATPEINPSTRAAITTPHPVGLTVIVARLDETDSIFDSRLSVITDCRSNEAAYCVAHYHIDQAFRKRSCILLVEELSNYKYND
jgi:hypothetical protein